LKKLISIVISIYNEEDVLDELKSRLQKTTAGIKNYDFEMIMVDHGSFDTSFEKLLRYHEEDKRFKILQLSRNFGCKDDGISAGLKYANGDATVLMDADLQDPPELITQFLQKWEEGYKIVYGQINKREGVSFIRRALSSLFYKIINQLTNKVIPRNASDFRLIDKKVYTVINRMEEKNKFVRGLIAWTGFKQIGVPFKRPPRFAGDTKAGFSIMTKVALNGILSFSYFPLKLATILGFILFMGSFIIFFLYIIFYFIYGRVVPGFTTIILVFSSLFGMLFFLLGIIGAYIARIYEEVKQRPSFIVKDEIGF